MKNTDIIKDKLNILDVVGSYVTLEKAGKTYKGKSPFTNEKTPSFFVSPEKGFFYCFSSGKGGDMFTFVQEIERVEFREALKILAEKAGVALDSSVDNDIYQQKDTQYKILDSATKHYEVHLRKNSDVVEYLLNRGLTKQTLIDFRIGFALDDWSDMYDYLTNKKYSKEDISAVGLIINKEGTSRYYDRFRSRIMFPLFDARARIVGFSGRIFGEDNDTKGAKYVNSPEGPLFDKSAVLYGYHTAKSAMSKADACILVEGQFDVLMAQQSGYTHTVAVSGTGLTDTHITMIRRFTDKVLLAFDSDNAGIKATRRSALAAYRYGMRVYIIDLPEGTDPADLIAQNKEKWAVAVKDAKEYIDYRLDLLSRKELSFEEKKKYIQTDIFTFVSLMKSAIDQDKALQKISLFLGVSLDAVRNDFAQFNPDEDISSLEISQDDLMENKKIVHDIPHEILYLYLYIQDKKYLLDEEIKTKITNIYIDIYRSDIDKDSKEIDDIEKNMQLFVLDERYGSRPENFFATSLLTMLIEEKLRNIQLQSNALLDQIRQAESRGDTEKIVQLQTQHQQLLMAKANLTQGI